MPKPGDLRVAWFPQIPCKPFLVPVFTPTEGKFVMDILANYDTFQFDNDIKPDYSNAGDRQVYSADSDGEGNPGWETWYDDEGEDIDSTESIPNSDKLYMGRGE